MAESNSNKIRLVVVTPYKTFYDDMVDIITVTSSDGEFGVMFGHSPLVAALKPGVCRIHNDGKITMFSCSEGYAEITRERVLIICNSAEWPEDIVISRIVNAYIDASGKIKEEMRLKKEQGIEMTSDSINMLARSKARMHLIELMGNDFQKERLAQLREEHGIS